ncbi:MAG: 3-deoxy-manno-octulosonate cytidylyltransferase [Elusimicrobiota bacterium]
MSFECVVVIPARISSKRIPNKPLTSIKGKSLIQRVWENAAGIKNADKIIISTDSQRIADTVENFGGKCVLSPADLKSGSDRVFWTVNRYYKHSSIVVNLQGDEPFISTGLIDKLIEETKKNNYVCSAYYPVGRKEADDSSVVKVVTDIENRALYFSRSLIPWNSNRYKKHLGIYVWPKDILNRFFDWEATELEKTEKLEQLRILENGRGIKMIESGEDSLGIDTYDNVEEAEEILSK